MSQDVRAPGSSNAQRRPASTAASHVCLAPSISSRISDRRSDTVVPAAAVSPGAPPPPATNVHRAMSATGVCASSAVPVSQGPGACALSAAPPAPGARASSTALLSHGATPSTGACTSGFPQPGHERPRIKRPSAGDGSPRFERRFP